MPMIFNQCGPPPAAADPLSRRRESVAPGSSRRRSRDRVPWAGALAPPPSALLFRWRIAWAIARGAGGALHRPLTRADDRFRRCRCASARRHWYVAWMRGQAPPVGPPAQSRVVARAGARPSMTLHASKACQTQAGTRQLASYREGG